MRMRRELFFALCALTGLGLGLALLPWLRVPDGQDDGVMDRANAAGSPRVFVEECRETCEVTGLRMTRVVFGTPFSAGDRCECEVPR